MKHILILFLIFLISSTLFGGTKAEIIKKEGSILTIAVGLKDGVEVGMKGLVQKMVRRVPINLAIFVVKSTAEDTSTLSIEKANQDAEIELAVQVEFYKTLIPLKVQLERLKRNISGCLKKKYYKRAGDLITQALAIKPDDEEMKKLAKGAALMRSTFTVADYFSYQAMHPDSPFQGDLKEKLYKTYPTLPPRNYFDMALKMKKNSQGYFEMEFKNLHIMIYIPEMKLFVDKYEVSNYQYLKYAKDKNVATDVLEFSTLKNYPLCCKNHPAIVSYEEAEEYCKTNKMRLPTEEEWEIIAGRDKGEYPWGDTGVDDSNLYRANFESLDDGYIDLAPVDSFVEFESPYGVVNMSGNVPEWVTTKLNKGGGFLSEKEELKITSHSEDTAYVGFRCVMEVENDAA